MQKAPDDFSRPASSCRAELNRPKLALPPGSCDAHFHVFGPSTRFSLAPEHEYTPPEAPKEMLFALHGQFGFSHGVVVQPNCYGYDNAVTVDTVAASPNAYCGIALVPVTVSDSELKRLDAAGIRGARFHFMTGRAGPAIEEVMAFSRRLAEIGWHLQLQIEAARLGALASNIKRSATPVMIDHMGRINASLGLDQPAFQTLLEMMTDKNIWVKVSGIDRSTRQGPPYVDAVPFARKLVEEFGDRVVWGTDWPHVNHAGPVPNDCVLIDCLAEIAPSEAQRQALLVDNPRRFYHF